MQTVSNKSQGGQNFPVKGSTVLRKDAWYHAAVTFDGRYWKIYLNGALERMTGADTGATRHPRWDSLQHASIATALNACGTPGSACAGSTPQPAGFFHGLIDEVRLWSVARSQAEIRSTINSEVTAAPGLVARWGLNEGSGKSVAGPPGILVHAPLWVARNAPFDLDFDTTPPAAPAGLHAMEANRGIALDWNDNADLV